jgi:hypothetical protein
VENLVTKVILTTKPPFQRVEIVLAKIKYDKVILIKRGGGTGPMKPGNLHKARCQFLQNGNILGDEDEY